MATFGEFLRKEREKKGINQSDFGLAVGLIMTDVSKIENDRKKFPFNNLHKLASFINYEFEILKTIYVADIIVDEVQKYNCSEKVFTLAEKQLNYVNNKKVKQGIIEFDN